LTRIKILDRIKTMNTTPSQKKLSGPQKRFLQTAAQGTARDPKGSYRTPFLGNRHAGRKASAWYRTAQSLANQGLISLARTGDAQTATLTEAGWAVVYDMRHQDAVREVNFIVRMTAVNGDRSARLQKLLSDQDWSPETRAFISSWISDGLDTPNNA
jgi:hypothetical protein